MHWIRSLGQNIWINHPQTTVWHRTRKLCIAHPMGTDSSATRCCIGRENEKITCIRLVAIDGEEHIRPGDSLVDDTMTGSTNDDHKLKPVSSDIDELTTSEEARIAKMEEIIKFFLDLIQVTGGDLAPEKCVWYLISH
jgi:hypothetical protein